MSIRLPLTARGPECAWVLECPLSELIGHWLRVDCGNYPCRQAAEWSFYMLCDHYPAHITLDHVIKLLRCSQCGRRPSMVAVCQTSGSRKKPDARGWVLQVHPVLKILDVFNQPYLPLTTQEECHSSADKSN